MTSTAKRALSGFAALGFTVLAAVIFILMSVLFFFLTVWIVKVGAGFAGYTPDANWVILSAGIMSAAGILAAAINQ